ncbi:hypothetical protein ABIB73_005544 [Bradyrhizobium sp. F1.4.3]|uniref:hypothetical protein n=1 Tax=Bradyrhizobium sp. F1.4.3 TaxID=3156356 RepID=UPI00339A0E0D
MPALLRPALSALVVACLLSAASLASSGPALAQAKQQASPAQAAPTQAAPAQTPTLKQVALTDKQLDGVLAAQKDMDAITEKLPENTAPDQKVIAQLDGVAKKHGFASYDDYDNVVDNVSLVLGGFDPSTKKYVGTEAVLKTQIAQVQADKKMPAKDKKEAIDELNQALKTPAPAVENKGNIDLVGKYYDKLVAALGDDQN